MDTKNGGSNPYQRSRMAVAAAARKKIQTIYESAMRGVQQIPQKESNDYLTPPQPGVFYDTPAQSNNSNYEPRVNTEATPLDVASLDFEDATSQTTELNSYVPAMSVSEIEETVTEPQPTFERQTFTPKSGPTLELPKSDIKEPSIEESPAEPTPIYDTTDETSALKDAPISQSTVNKEWAKYHSAWQSYYQNYYSEYYAKAAQSYLDTEKLKNERAAGGELRKKRRFRRFAPIAILLATVLAFLFMQYNRMIFAPIMAYVAPDVDTVATSIEAVDPSVTQSVSADPRLIIPKLNVDVPVAFGIHYNDVMEAMNHGVAQFSIPGANAMPGQIGNLVISGHSAGDIYSNNPYKFIFSGLERLEVGDLLYINYESVRYTYQMTGREVVEPNNVQALIYHTDKPMLTLITCTPLGTSRYRLLISAEQISPEYDQSSLGEEQPNEDTPDNNDYSMPSNEPSFFERLFGN